jgi:hypothetical protein
MTKMLSQRFSYVEVEQKRDQHKILHQRLVLLQEEEIRVIGALATA